VQRHSDDGEPSGTAGKPIAGAILSFQITQVLVIVVRYFGGTKLGTGGLIQAYKTAATMAIEDAGVVEKRWQRKVEIVCNYAQLPELMNILKQRQAEKQSIVQVEDCRLTYVVAEEQLTEMQAAVSAIGPMVIHLGELI
jgi:putative IMPACT (imprinted ancient) family translation regulator